MHTALRARWLAAAATIGFLMTACGPSNGPELMADNQASAASRQAADQNAQKANLKEAEQRAAVADGGVVPTGVVRPTTNATFFGSPPSSS